MTDALNERIARLEAEIEAVKREMQDFTYTVSHDLRADLRHILAFAEIVQEDYAQQLDAEGQSHLATITGAAKHMGKLMDGLLAYSRLGAVPLQPVPVELCPVVGEICHQLAERHPGQLLQWQVAQDLPVVLVDQALFRQVLEYLLGNAVKFSAQRSPACIEVGWAREAAQDAALAEPAMATLWVRDNGAGFNPEMTGKLFHVFARLHSQRDFEGIGMGLALTRKIVERHGGTVSAEGVVNGGCCIRVTVPLACA
jgi:light-regulated signal transduction histidine kinase (bacteriophytochrome)